MKNFKNINVESEKYSFKYNIGKHLLSDEKLNAIKSKINFKPYIISESENYIAKIIKEKELNYLLVLSTYFEISEKIISFEDGTVTLNVKVNNGIEQKTVTFKSDILTNYGIKELLNYGIRFKEQNSNYLLDYLLRSETNAKIAYGFKRHGYFKIGNQLCFKSNTIITNSEITNNYIYQGDMDLSPTGNMDEWSKMIKEEVISNTPLEFVLCSSFASSLISLLNLSYDFGSIIINLANTSSKGKTTAAMLAASVFSNPQLNRGTAISYNGTENAIQEHISKCNGLTVVLDEAAVCNVQNLQKLLYSIALGRSKMRLSGDSTQREIQEFSSVIISTAEFNFVDDNSMDGIKTRVFEVTEPLTKSAKNSDNIKSTVIKNYALAGNMFIEHLLKKGEYCTRKQYIQTKEYIYDMYRKTHKHQSPNSLIDRIISKLSIIYQAAIYSNEIFDFKFDLKVMLNFIFKIIDRIVDIPTAEEELLQVVYEDYFKNQNNYSCKSLSISNNTYSNTLSNTCIGLVRDSKDERYFEICIMKNYFEKLMTTNKISDYKKRLRKLREQGTLVSQKDRQISDITIIDNMPKAKAYIFKFPFSKLSA